MSLQQLIRPRICELGKIKIGGLGEPRPTRDGQSTWNPPVKLDHFVITTLNRDDYGRLIPDVDLMNSLRQYADPDGKLRRIPIALLSNDVQEVLQAAWVWYCGKKLGARSDGTTLTKFHDPDTGARLPQPETVPWKLEYADRRDRQGQPFFKLHTMLNVVIAAGSARWGGVYKFRTTSQITASQLYGSLMHLRELTGGVLRGLPLRLVVRPVQVAPEGRPNTVYVVHLELVGNDLAEIQESAMRRAQVELTNARSLAVAQREYRALLSAPDQFDDDADEDEVVREFYPQRGSREDMLRGLEDLCAATGQTTGEVVRRYARAAGLGPNVATRAEDLTDEALAAVIEAAMQAR